MSLTKPRIVVTGASGFLGGHVVRELLAHQATVIAAVRDPQRLAADLTVPTLVGDLRDPSYRASVIESADVLVHAGTWSSFWGHADAERELFLEPSLDLLERAQAAGLKRFVTVSSVTLSRPALGDQLVQDDAAPHPRDFWPHHAAMVEVELKQRELSSTGTTQFVSARLGHFVGRGNSMGIVSALVPRLGTRQVPWVSGGKARLPLVSGVDMGRALALAAIAPADALGGFEAINIVGDEQPTVREAFTYLAELAGVPAPAYSVPLRAAYGFGALMEAIHPLTRARAPFLTRSLVFVGENWHMETAKAKRLLGYEPTVTWRDAMREQVAERAELGNPWPALAQAHDALVPAPVNAAAGVAVGSTVVG